MPCDAWWLPITAWFFCYGCTYLHLQLPCITKKQLSGVITATNHFTLGTRAGKFMANQPIRYPTNYARRALIHMISARALHQALSIFRRHRWIICAIFSLVPWQPTAHSRPNQVLHNTIAEMIDSGEIWLLDSGATDHITRNACFFRTYFPSTGQKKVHMANGKFSMVPKTNTIWLCFKILLNKCSTCPQFILQSFVSWQVNNRSSMRYSFLKICLYFSGFETREKDWQC